MSIWSLKNNAQSLYQQSEGIFPLINGLRFFSFVWILIFHTLYIYGLIHGKDVLFGITEDASFYLWWIWNADKAVDLFFVISGFLIGLILFRELDKEGDIKLKRFYLRRYLRLTPLYAVIVFLYWSSGAKNHEWVWTNIFYINNFLPVDKMALHWTWSLAVEEQFYLLLPLLLMFIFKMAGRPFIKVLLGLLAISFLIRFGVLYWFPELWNAGYRDMLSDKVTSDVFYPRLYDNLITRYGPFVCGVLSAYAYYFHRAALKLWLSRNRALAFSINLFALLTVLFFTCFPVLLSRFEQSGTGLKLYLVFHRSLFSAGVAWFMLSAFLNLNHFTWLEKVLSLKIWQPFSQLTYSMYLIHFMVIFIIIKSVEFKLSSIENISETALLWGTIGVTSLISLSICVVIGILCWLLIEKPFLNMRDLFKVNRGATSTAPAQTVALPKAES